MGVVLGNLMPFAVVFGVDPSHHGVAPRGGGSGLSTRPAVVGTPHDPRGHSQTRLVVNFRLKKEKSGLG
jgi:hypothetical protein